MDEKKVAEIHSRIILDESKVRPYTVPDALATPGGGRITTAFEWANRQRPRLLRLFEENMYGVSPGRPDETRFELLSLKQDALGGLAVRKEVRFHFRMADGRARKMDMMLWLPKNAPGPSPAFLGLNFRGNACVSFEKDIPLSENPHVMDSDQKFFHAPPATEETRGFHAARWQLETVLARGYATAAIYYGDLFPDAPTGFDDSVFGLFHDKAALAAEEKEFGAIGAWAWGLSRAMDYLEGDPAVDARRVIVHGHSRLGKTALWAGALDQRFAMVISNNSGCAGAALKRRRFGENIEWLTFWRPYWFHHNYPKFSGREDELPVDQHMLAALIAPRPVYVASAEDDLYADPKGEFLSLVHAAPAYGLFGSGGLGMDVMPEVNKPVHGDLGYHVRTGGHDITEFDWKCFLDFADKRIR